MKVKLKESAQQFLTSKKGYKKSWFRSFFAIFFACAIAAVILGLSLGFGPGSPNASSESILAKNLNATDIQVYLNTAQIMTYVVFALVAIPFLFLFTFWIIGINQTSKSRLFHMFMWIVIFLAILIAVIALVLFIRCVVTNNDIYI